MHVDRTVAVQSAGSPADEYKSVCEFMRMYATLRFYRLALLLGTTGSIVTALSSAAAASTRKVRWRGMAHVSGAKDRMLAAPRCAVMRGRRLTVSNEVATRLREAQHVRCGD